jgi:polyhydroxyalkanoate synthesis regulator phasin
MTTENDDQQDTSFDDARQRAQDTSRRLGLAGIGAVALACDIADQMFERFVDRGQKVRTHVGQKAEDVRLHNQGARNRVADYVRTGMDATLDRLNLPSKGDVDTINVKLNILSRKIDDLHGRADMPSDPGQPFAPAVSIHEPDDTDLAT